MANVFACECSFRLKLGDEDAGGTRSPSVAPSTMDSGRTPRKICMKADVKTTNSIDAYLRFV